MAGQRWLAVFLDFIAVAWLSQEGIFPVPGPLRADGSELEQTWRANKDTHRGVWYARRAVHALASPTMYKLIRRISSSFFPRPDRPWSEDATSSAPQIGRKRRLSSTEPDLEPSAKKQRSESADVSDSAQTTREDTPVRTGKETEEPEVKAVTKGVKEVELEDKPAASAKTAAAVPLPDSPILQPTQEADEVKPESAEEKAEEPVAEATTTEQSPSAPEDAPAVTPELVAHHEKTSDTNAKGEDIPGLSAVGEKGAGSKEAEADGAEKKIDTTEAQPEADKSTNDQS
ncbi:uncharacterized protein C8Q71DRAFT_908782 [Rhodofomes roseus]|uniref:Uncharacterized protein n=1 Tax=Rhodofomes roseus TaxID=34475 RepID=A0ABQ8KCC1_9APHY|nr:uncharacterized protein C8Q71DRAFT_908782 [Rhodofomes roseus]KAH9834959.1 hypothetical protein C8Q71DRAFT_908782 [Rhodofomes roseus]